MPGGARAAPSNAGRAEGPLSTNDLYLRFPALGRAVFALHRSVFRVTHGRLGGRLARHEVVLLTTVGRRTGRPRTWPLLVLRIDGRAYLVASDGGRPGNPGWWWNLTADPRVEVERRGRRSQLVARTVSNGERADLWPRIVATAPWYSTYQQRTARTIPVVELTPRHTAAATDEPRG